jgi:hypothetical protein
VPQAFKMKGKSGYLLTESMLGAASLKKRRCRTGVRMITLEPENSYPNLRTRRLRKTHRVAGPKIFKAVGPLLRL